MDQLPTDQQEALRKTNTERLRIMAAKTYNVGDDELETMDRTALLDVIATDIQSINQSRFFYSGLSNLNHCEVHYCSSEGCCQ